MQKCSKKHGITTIRNFDALNDINNLRYSGECITHHGLHHQIVISVMDLPPGCKGAHDSTYYIEKLKEILKSEIPFHSIAFKDASGTSNPRKVFETIKEARKIVAEDTVLWFHTHDTAGTAIAQYLAAIEAGIDGIDLSKSPCNGGTCQPDILTMWHALKGSEYSLDIDVDKVIEAEKVFEDCMKDYFLPAEATKTSPLIPFSPMPGGALTANTMMMRDTNTLHLYPEVIKEMSDVVAKGGFGASVTPVSQFYFQQAYLNVTHGKWEKIADGYGNMVLGYFGRTPVKPDETVIERASSLLNKPVFDGDPLSILDDGIPKAEAILKENNLPINDENVFIVASCESKGVDFLLGKSQVHVRKNTAQDTKQAQSTKTVEQKLSPKALETYKIKVNGETYHVEIAEDHTVEYTPVSKKIDQTDTVNPKEQNRQIKAPAPGTVLRVNINKGDHVKKDQVILVLEAMKLETEIVSPFDGMIEQIYVEKGAAVQQNDRLVSVSS